MAKEKAAKQPRKSRKKVVKETTAISGQPETAKKITVTKAPIRPLNRVPAPNRLLGRRG